MILAAQFGFGEEQKITRIMTMHFDVLDLSSRQTYLMRDAKMVCTRDFCS